ncbi:MAG: FtsW/RodA/SpoVE family cell cycle protein [Patescibacteria group bacterium]
MFFQSIKKMDWWLNGCILFLATASLTMIYSAKPSLFYQQSVWFILAFITIIIFAQIDWRPLINYRWIIFSIYFFSIALLVVTYFFAPVIRDTRSWLVFGPVQFQTSEFAKLGLIILFSYFFARRHIGIAHWYNLLIPFFYFAIPAGLVLLQPDMGTTLILLGLWLGYLFISGIKQRHILIGLVFFIALGFWGWNSFLKDYQKERIIGLFNPGYDPLGINYNTIQSKIAIGSAGLWGKGFHQGTQVQLGFLPEPATDFIFASFIEEWGLSGGFLLLGIFGLLIFRIIKAGLLCENNFGKLVCLGTIVVFMLHFMFNIGSNIGLLPVIGLPLPFFSYGGSSLLTNAILIGIIQNIVVRFNL